MQLEEGMQANPQVWDPNGHPVTYGRQQAPPQSDGFFHPLETCEPTLHIGYASKLWSINLRPSMGISDHVMEPKLQIGGVTSLFRQGFDDDDGDSDTIYIPTN